MYINDTLQRDAASRGGFVRCATNALRWTAYGVLALFRRIVILVLTGLSVGGVALWLIFVRLAHDTQFPTAQVLGLSAVCALGILAYLAAMELLVPGSLSERR